MQINQHPNQAQAVFSTVSPKPPTVAKQQDAPAIASTRVEEERDTVERIRPNVQAIAQLLDSDRHLQLPPMPAASYPPADSVGTTTSPGTDPPPSAPILGDPNASTSTEPIAAPAYPSPAGPTATTADAVEVSRKEGGGALSGDSEGLSTADQQKVEELKARDRDVRAHEQAHLAAAGAHSKAGPSYEYQRGPDNRQYAVGGEVQIDTSEVSGDPQATIRKAQTIRRAATEPSSQDRSVASAAAQMEAKARREISQQQTEAMRGDGARDGRIGKTGETAATGHTFAGEETAISDGAHEEHTPGGPDISPTGGTGKFVSRASGETSVLFDLMA